MLASARTFPKFVLENAAMYHELWKPGSTVITLLPGTDASAVLRSPYQR